MISPWQKWLLCFTLLALPKIGMAETYTFAAIENNPYQKAIARVLGDAFADMGHSLNVKYLPGKRALIMSNTGHLDGEVARIATTTQSYPNLIPLPLAIGQFKATAITYNAPHKYTGFEQFKPYRLGILRGTIWSEKRTKNYQRMQLNSYSEMIRMLQVNRFDYGFGDHAIFTHIKETTKASFKVLEPPIFQLDLYPFVHKDKAALIPQLVAALNKIDQSEGLKNRVNRYFRIELQRYLKD